jgi:hypothetical protein
MIPHHAHLSPSSPSSPPLHFYKYFFSPTNKIWKNLKVQENFDFLLWCTSLTQGCGLDKIKKCVSIYCYNNMDFSFPDPPETISSLQEIRITLNEMLIAEKLHSYCSYRFQEIKNKYIYCKCRQCDARLVYRKQN